MSGQSILEICDYCDKVYKSLDLSDFKGYFCDAYDDVMKFISLNKKHFVRGGVDFSSSLFILLLIELSTFGWTEKATNEKDDNNLS